MVIQLFCPRDDIYFDYFWTDIAFEIYSPVNVVKQLFHPRNDVRCDTNDMGFSPLGVIWVLTIFRLIRLSRYAVMIHA